jgi:hypothetical protein
MPRPKPITTKCAVHGCEKSIKARGLCGPHYYSEKKAGTYGGNRCSVSGCMKYSISRGMCSNHYQSARTVGSVPVKKCRDCDRPGIKRGYCNGCYTKHRWSGALGSEKCCIVGCASFTIKGNMCLVHSKRKNSYGLTNEQQSLLLNKTDCEICGAPWKSIDHDHSSGEFRGILCSKCNVAIGMMRDRPDLLRAAADYLERKSCATSP